MSSRCVLGDVGVRAGTSLDFECSADSSFFVPIEPRRNASDCHTTNGEVRMPIPRPIHGNKAQQSQRLGRAITRRLRGQTICVASTAARELDRRCERRERRKEGAYMQPLPKPKLGRVWTVDGQLEIKLSRRSKLLGMLIYSRTFQSVLDSWTVYPSLRICARPRARARTGMDLGQLSNCPNRPELSHVGAP